VVIEVKQWLVTICFILALGIYGLIKLDFHPFIVSDEAIMVQIAYHEKTHTLWVAPYSTLGEVLEQIELDESVDLDQINENLVLKHNDKFIVPLKTDTPCISINSADLETLTLLKGVGPSIAKRIVDYRAVHGLFQNIEDIMEVKGIGIKTFEKMQEQLCI